MKLNGLVRQRVGDTDTPNKPVTSKKRGDCL